MIQALPPAPPLPRGPGHTLPPWALAPAPHDAVLSLLPALAALLRACSGPAECMALHNKLACDPIEALDGSGCSCQIQLLTVLPEPVCLPVTGSQCGVTADLILNHFDGECESVCDAAPSPNSSLGNGGTGIFLCQIAHNYQA